MNIACHGWNHAISLEGEGGDGDLFQLADLAQPTNFFKDRIVHFGSCKTLSNPAYAKPFKQLSGARPVCGYSISVEAMKSAIADIALFNHIMGIRNVDSILNKDQSKF